MTSLVRKLVYGLLEALGLQLDGFPNEGIAAFGYWIRPARARDRADYRGANALERCLALGPRTVIDVGSGAGRQARIFADAGCAVTGVDFGVSAYAREAPAPEGFRLVLGDINTLAFDDRYDLVWCAHTLEHQPNAGVFLSRLNGLCADGGWVCITLPICHRAMWGGHLSLWTPGLLAYNIAFAGYDVSAAELIHGHREFSLLYQPRKVALPALDFDKGDIDRLRPFLPPWCREGRDSW